MRTIFVELIFTTVLAVCITPALAAYEQPASTVSAGGGVTTSANYENLGIIGQPAIVGSSASASYTANHGFLHVLGDGYKLLYPVISTTPGTLTFSIMATKSGDQALGISNSGGSTLAWTVTKGSDPQNIFSFTPGSGTNAGSVTVTANAAALGVGTYSNTLTISGAGIEQTAQVQLTLNVTPFTYRLTVTVVSDTATKGGGTVTDGFGTINCTNTGNNPDSMTGTCLADLLPGTSITLHQLPDSDSTVATWSEACSGTNDCGISNIAANTAVTATFPYSYMSKVVSNNYVSDSLLAAYGHAAATDTINARAVTFVEGTPGSDVLFNSGKAISLVGGLDAYYQKIVGGFTTIQPPLLKAVKIGGSGSRLNIKGPMRVKP